MAIFQNPNHLETDFRPRDIRNNWLGIITIGSRNGLSFLRNQQTINDIGRRVNDGLIEDLEEFTVDVDKDGKIDLGMVIEGRRALAMHVLPWLALQFSEKLGLSSGEVNLTHGRLVKESQFLKDLLGARVMKIGDYPESPRLNAVIDEAQSFAQARASVAPQVAESLVGQSLSGSISAFRIQEIASATLL